MTEAIPREAIAEHASQVHPGDIAATVITAFFFAIGWLFGASWRGVVYCCIAIRYGYRTGAHMTVAPSQPEPPRGGGRPGPGGTLIEE